MGGPLRTSTTLGIRPSELYLPRVVKCHQLYDSMLLVPLTMFMGNDYKCKLVLQFLFIVNAERKMGLERQLSGQEHIMLLKIRTLTSGGTQLSLWTLWTPGMHMYTFIQRYTRIRIHKKL